MTSAATPPIERPRSREIGGMLKLASPLIVNNLAIAGMGVADTVMSGKIGARELAAVAVGSSVWMLFFLFALGVLMAISPISARHIGGGRGHLIGRYARQGFWLSLMLSSLVFVVLYFGSRAALTAIGIDEGFRDLTADYLRAIVFGAPAGFAYLALRYTTEGVGWTRPVMFVSIGALGVNVTGNWIFMFGNLGAPELGAVGAGVASAITMYFMFFALLIYMWRSPRYHSFDIFTLGRGPQWMEMRQILALGLPIMVSIVAEAGLFSAVSLLMGKLSASIVAAHQIALNYASTMFMIPMGLNSATTVLVSQAIGQGNLELARSRGFLGIGLCAGFMAISAGGLLLFRDGIVGIYTQDPQVQAIALSLLLVAAIFQISDGIQVGAAGALRGLHDTRVPMFLTTFSYWVIAFPLAYAAALSLKLSPAMIWGGFVVGLTISAVLLVTRFYWASKQTARLTALSQAD
ncbi:MAG: MATE family efflux transporter [Pseudomonadota bacterium]